MDSLVNIIGYILKNYPFPDDMSNSRITKLIYLSDWKSAIERGETVSGINWYFNHHGPYVDDIIDTLTKNECFEVITTQTIFGGKKKLARLKSPDETFEVEEFTEKCLKFVVKKTKDRKYDDFIEFVYSTYPVVVTEKYNKLDLVELAKDYKEIAGNELKLGFS
ncbi:Panacea domain-containing protein [Pseudomonas sp. 32.2.56]|uniref:Panacea domain-containing protein n=1 Tax=Pseudomonas sp. 32.2.56 TaxID=2969303 RepID=UPI0021506ABC|nr:Panacea domain-containing protein [Pseudomonas sp. 32.2.56]MCR4511112.1 Panacea domain-containing protein [Pseudomonas sp. 32.2.56]